MSNPKRGTPAGKAPTTGDLELTKEYLENHERIFGDRKPVRGRFVYTDGGKPLPEPVKVDDEWSDPGMPAGGKRISEEEVYGNCVATDGTPLDSRKKHRDYMKANGLAMTSDFQDHWQKKAAERERAGTPGADPKRAERIKEAVARSLYNPPRKK